MNGKLNKNVGFSLMIVAFFFLFEPSYGLIDPLPDIVGYSILCLALINLADLNDRVSSAFRSFRLGIIFSALRVITLIVLQNIFVDDEQSVGLLLFVFVFAVCELVCIVPGYRSLFEGLLSLGIFEGGEAVYYKRREKGKNVSEKLKALTVAFIIVKNLLWLIPELTTLKENTSYEFIEIMRILSMIVVVPLSVVWLICMTVYFVRIIKDRPFIEALEKKYRERTEGADDFFTCRSVCTYLAVMIAAFVLSIDVYSGNINYLPDVLFYIALTCSVFFLRKHSKMWMPITMLSILGAVSSVLMFLSEKAFFSEFYVESIRRDPDAYTAYNQLLIQYMIQSIIFAVTSFITMLFLRDLFKKRLLKKDNEIETVRNRSKTFLIKSVIYILLALLSSFGSVYYALSLPIQSYSWIYAYSNVISGALSLCFIASAFTLISTVTDKLKTNTPSYL